MKVFELLSILNRIEFSYNKDIRISILALESCCPHKQDIIKVVEDINGDVTIVTGKVGTK